MKTLVLYGNTVYFTPSYVNGLSQSEGALIMNIAKLTYGNGEEKF